MTTYKTPDVYIEEISVFPPSVAEVETAVPAFVGYTEQATQLLADDLLYVPTLIESLLEYETLFGAGPEIKVNSVQINDANAFVSASIASTYYLYDSLRLYFDNGGGKAYIVSVGSYADSIDRDDIKSGLDAVSKSDEPTILLFPDAATLGEDDLAAVQQHALMQCGDLGDRVAVLDTRVDDPLGTSFRNKVGINNLKYGAAYSPWLKLNYDKRVGYVDVATKITRSGAAVTLKELTADPGLLTILSGLDSSLADVTTIAAATTATAGGVGKTVASRFNELSIAYRAAKSGATIQPVFGFLYALADLVDGYTNGGTKLANASVVSGTQSTIATTLKPVYTALIALEQELAAKLGADKNVPQYDVVAAPADAAWGAIFGANAPAASNVIPAAANTDPLRADVAFVAIMSVYTIIANSVAGVATSAAGYATTLEQSLLQNFAVYAGIIKGINSTLTAAPPSGAVAGIYALVDGQRGVWKAPANVSLNSVIEPTYYFDSSETDDLNVDVEAGKSINAIRAFAGKGTLVWGARTLAGNDNEWRYVSVRRFFNMVEESVKKSTYWAVFEPNDANTWVKVKGMVENYLTQKWRDGALAGATTKDAFYVRCALGVTMNAQDILEGRMNVEIGMAVVRPAEFIVLKFSHKLQTS